MINLILKNGEVLPTKARTVTGIFNAYAAGKIDVERGLLIGAKIEKQGQVIGVMCSPWSWVKA
jgi:hypothetical protein